MSRELRDAASKFISLNPYLDHLRLKYMTGIEQWRALRTTLCAIDSQVADPLANSALWCGSPFLIGGSSGRWGMATIDDARARLVAGQAARLRDDARLADELLRRGKIDEARELVARNFSYANAIWHELHLLTQPPREIPIRGKSR